MSVRQIIPMVHCAQPCASCEARPYSVCNAISDQDLAVLAANVVQVAVAAGSTFIVEGEKPVDFYSVTRGTARMFKMLPDGRRQIVGFAHIGHFLGLAATDTYGFSAEAIDPLELCRFSRPRMEAMIADFPALERRLRQTAAHELVLAQEQMLLLGRKTARERLASFLLAQSAVQAVGRAPLATVHLPMSRLDIADYLGLTGETVSRGMTKLRQDGLISLPEPDRVVLNDRATLAAIANADLG